MVKGYLRFKQIELNADITQKSQKIPPKKSRGISIDADSGPPRYVL
jgi:hypothetical protein